MNRLRELDFLRGIAILLVLLRHIPSLSFLQTMGWIGVDLFFVLSGFFVSGILFKEFIKWGNIRPKLFLIRRGFKIYPVYYLFYIPYFLLILHEGRFNWTGLLSDLAFIQNYVWGYGYAYKASWSLAVEEHFYFGLCFLLWAGLKSQKIRLGRPGNKQLSIFSFEVLITLMLMVCLLLRLVFNFLLPETYSDIKLFTITHFRIDSLLMGALISYFYYFRLKYLDKFFHRYKYLLLAVSLLGLSWTPFLDAVSSLFVKTFGFTLLYTSFGIFLVFFLLQKNINQLLDKILSARLVNIVSRIGFCSYSIYIIHTLVINISRAELGHYPWLNQYSNKYVFFVLTLILSVLTGMLMTYTIEKYFLKLRDIYFPGRI